MFGIILSPSNNRVEFSHVHIQVKSLKNYHYTYCFIQTNKIMIILNRSLQFPMKSVFSPPIMSINMIILPRLNLSPILNLGRPP